MGSGAGGIPIADRLSEAGHKVLLIEKGPPSTGRWGGIMKPDWLNETSLTRFDVPGLCNQIWADPTGAICTDVDQMAGCMLGGGTAVNSGLWWKPHPADWDVNFPEGWHSDDMAAATERVFSRIPGTIAPSMDGKRYLSQGFDMLGGSLKAAGWEYLIPNEHPDRKDRTYGHSTFMYSGGREERPLGYLPRLSNGAQGLHPLDEHNREAHRAGRWTCYRRRGAMQRCRPCWSRIAHSEHGSCDRLSGGLRVCEAAFPE